MDRQELGIRMEPDYFGPLWRYVRNDKITDIDYNGNQLWITDVENERYLIRSHGITEKFVEQFSHRIANEVSKPFNKKIICWRRRPTRCVSVLCMNLLPYPAGASASVNQCQCCVCR